MMNKNKKGFSLLEVLISITILLVGVTSAYSLVTSSVKLTKTSQNKIVAAMLAQEGIEVVRNIRDNNWDQGLAWGSNNLTPGNYTVQYNSTSLTSIALPGPFLSKNTTTSRYQYSSDPFTIFKRTINILNISADEIRVISAVAWTEGIMPKSLAAEDHLFNWK